jgi:ornithine carbamoyltransferase
MGEPVDIWDERISLLRPYQVNADVITSTGNPAAKFMHCLPSFHDMNTVVGQQIAARTGMVDGLEVTDSLFESDVNICWEQAENRLHTVKAAMVATLAN